MAKVSVSPANVRMVIGQEKETAPNTSILAGQEKMLHTVHPENLFSESEWIRMIFLLSDTQNWLNEMAAKAMMQLPVKQWRKLKRKSYFLGVTALAHIIERHYYKIPRYPGISKFTVPLAEVLSFLRDAAHVTAMEIPGSLNFHRTFDVGMVAGFDSDQQPTSIITVVTDAGGKIVTAFPGKLRPGII